MHRLIRFMIRSLLVSLWLLVAVNPVHASLEDRLNEYYGSLGGGASISPSAMYQGQSANHFSGGGIRIRTPVNNYQLMSFQAPKLQYGCGGIDAFLGGFSFINKEQLVAMARQIGSTAVSTAFYLALDSMSPQLSGLMKRLQEWANKANQFNINSCEAGTRMGAAMWRGLGGDKQKFCERANTGKGVLADEFTSRMVCNDSGWDFSFLPGTNKNDDDRKIKEMAAGNIVWRALKGAGIKDNNLAELIMSITGTIIIPEGHSNDPPKPRVITATITYDQFLRGDTNFIMMRCDNNDKCMGVSQQQYTNSKMLSQLRERVRLGIDHVVKAVADPSMNIANCTTCPNAGDALTVIELSEYPIFAMLQAEYDAGMQGSLIANEYRELLAKEIAYRFFAKAATPLLTALANDGEAVSGTEDMRAELAANLRHILESSQNELNAEQQRKGGLNNIIGVYMQMKKMATARYAPSLTQRLRLAQVLRR
ncbi:conjugal transfer protein TraH [Candidatus Thiothrix anitrata]|uniref:Conjugal transfer protein TraH n=1 Tax=Candidatus Thiothrix anitrata TaxID=2823902 RepID=A0ABX7X8L7_9GAMM|nr:conjugal transfer protein TraH [Candidatus Thiothrix anitrata]QTR51577.1 conjugal transfer protein TraH [Candidatus Thiothrix anitrata]